MAIAHPRQSHDTDGPKANHALTFKLDHSSGAAQGEAAITELKLDYLYGSEPEISGE